jgi:lipid-A-disaccharide synthase
MVIFYRAPWLGYQIVRRIIRTPHLSLVNILAARRLVPELMPWHGDRRVLTSAVLEMMADPGRLIETRRALLELVRPLKAPAPRTAADNAADLVMGLLRR